ENDMIRGGPDTIKVSLKKLIELWTKNQNNAKTLSQEAIEEYVSLIKHSGYINAPFFDSIDFRGEGLEIRTSEGRHRIKAAEKAGLTTIYVLKPAENAMDMAEIAGVTEELFPQ